ncbi:putative nuclease of putative toxin-antitoxin system [Rhizomicrobium palustre]|jgi:predicted nuclease of predicted toxin-antitoxin system|uniref:Putative nuclease of putative toxin-antitoxin system n=1 Tax=Rhizomicrobium palustre TaxID=189966 RepID=A0A846N3Y1_9PROT|nr:DUF5615 family PIN-like protein [Rhizomicrobium palustre]NIK90175.1 putative nuclease of putative toxin-antitoxin system [Rhizomicrobium palustre]
MNFLVDAQLPPQLAIWLRDRGHQAWSMCEMSLQNATDRVVWELAERFDAVIVTKDEDFVLLASTRSGPQILWVRTGNLVNRLLLARFERAWPEVISHLGANARVVELR